MAIVIFLVVLLIVGVAVPVLDRLTEAPIMRRDVNAGTQWWRVRERRRQAEDPQWPLGALEEPEGVLDELRAPRSRRPRRRSGRN